MTDQHYFQTTKTVRGNHPRRVRPGFNKRFVQNEMWKQKEIENNRMAEARIRSMITALERSVSSLNGSIDAVLKGSPVRDPSNFAYPPAASAMSARRDNIRVTIAVLSGQLAKINDAQTEIKPSR
jgi:hypothetical protein